jgi:hypothetical protein
MDFILIPGFKSGEPGRAILASVAPREEMTRL